MRHKLNAHCERRIPLVKGAMDLTAAGEQDDWLHRFRDLIQAPARLNRLQVGGPINLPGGAWLWIETRDHHVRPRIPDAELRETLGDELREI